MRESITYLVANYNNGRYIKACIDSLQAQSSQAWYCLIIDDHSTDDSLAEIQPFLTEQIQLVVNEENIGKSRSLIKLLALAQSDIVGILDPDDALYPQATECILQAYREHPAAGFVYSNYDLYDETLTTIIAPGISKAIPQGRSSMMHGFVGAIRTYRRSTYLKTAGYDPTILYAEDRDLVYKMEEVTPLVFVDQRLYKYRYVPNSQSNDPQKQRIGVRNHWHAIEKGLARRQSSRLRKAGHFLWFYCCQVAISARPRIVKVLLKYSLLPIAIRIAALLAGYRRAPYKPGG